MDFRVTVAAPGGKSRGTSRDRILDVSRTIVEDEGVEQLTIRRIAETVGRTQPAVYQHFASKDAILTALVVDGFGALGTRLERAARSDAASLDAIARAYVRFGTDRPNLYALMFVEPPAIAFAEGLATPKPARDAFAILAHAVARSQPQTADVETLTEIVWATLHGYVLLTIANRLRSGRAVASARLDVLVATIVAIAGRPPSAARSPRESDRE